MSLPIVYDEHYVTSLPEDHRFPMQKFKRIFELILERNNPKNFEIHRPHSDSTQWIKSIHDSNYVENFIGGELSNDHIREIGLPWSEGLVKRTITAIDGTLKTIELAVNHGLACNTAGGTHHAFPGRGSGFCILNDLAIGSQYAQKELDIKTVLVLDLDVHQGNGTAAFARDRKKIVTASIHCQDNYPFDEIQGDYDIPLPSGTSNKKYLSILKNKLPAILKETNPDLVLYDAGVDIHRDDRLGNMKITKEGISKRDSYVLESTLKRKIPIACVIGGGYDKNIRQLAQRHVILHERAMLIFRKFDLTLT